MKITHTLRRNHVVFQADLEIYELWRWQSHWWHCRS